MKYLGVWVIAMTLAHFVMCGFAAFLTWDAEYFWLFNWHGFGRFLYLMVLLIISVAVLIWRHEEMLKDKG